MSSPPRRELLAGLLVALFGLAAIREGLRLGVGTPARMGSGFVPLALGVLLCLVGIAIGFSRDEHDWLERASQRFDLRGAAMILAGAVAFVVVGIYGGLVPATFLSVFIAALGDRVNTVRSALVLSLAVTVVGTVIFGLFLKVPIPLFAGLPT